MEVLELSPLNKKSLQLILLESEFQIDWWFDATEQDKQDLIGDLRLISKEYLGMVGDLIEKYEPDFGVEENGSRAEETPSQDDPLYSLFKAKNIPFQTVDISENAELYLSSALGDHKTLLEQISEKIEEMRKEAGGIPKDNFKFQRLLVWRKYLTQQYGIKEDEVRYEVREAWMMMRILNIAKSLEKKKQKALFICDERHFEGISKLADELGIKVEQIKVERSANMVKNSIDSILNESIFNITPIKVKKKEKTDKICYFFDTDDNASPFDINMAYDAGFDVVIPYNNIKADQVTQLVQDAMFSRKVGAPTVYFVGGSDVDEADKVAETVLGALVPPFESPVIIDPRGSHTTATAVVAKTIEVARKKGWNDISGKKIAILGGTGPVGQIAALLAAKNGANPVITSRREQVVKDLAKKLNSMAGEGANEIIGILGANDDQKFELLKDADIIWSVAKAGIQMVSSEMLAKLDKNKIVCDINLVPPYGIEGLKPKYDDDEIIPGITGIGALAVGRLKYKVESNIFKAASEDRGKKIYNYNNAFSLASQILFSETIEIMKQK